MKRMKPLLLTVAAAIAATLGARAQSITYMQAGEKFTINNQQVAASPNGVSYEWFRNGVLISGCTGSSCEVSAAAAVGDNVQFQRRAIAKDCAIGTTANSNVITVTFCNVLINGVCWADRSVGSVPPSDAQTAMYFFQFNRATSWSSGGGTNWVTSINQNSNWLPANSPCPTGWRLPTLAEYQALIDNSIPVSGTWADPGTRGVPTTGSGGRFLGPKAGTCQFPNNMAGCILLQGAAYLTTAGSPYPTDMFKYYWTSTQASNTTGYAIYIMRNSLSVTIQARNKAEGHHVRCVQGG